MMKETRKRVEAFVEVFTMLVSMFAFSYFVYYSSNEEKNPADNLFSNVANLISKPVFALASASSGILSDPSVCCEKTKSGAKCINTDSSDCAPAPFKQSPTSCDSTSYCKLGTCYDSKEGICMENTPQAICQEKGGIWDERGAEEVPQCQLGCCVIADQAAFVPLVRCKRLATLFGTPIDYRKDITSEVQCIATAQSQDTGACVYEKDFSKTCKFTTRKDCNAQEGVVSTNSSNSTISSVEKKFYKDYLCSAEELGTDCARQTSTGCYQQKVYWLDSCGNRENVYSTDLVRSWNNGRVLDADKICNKNDGTQKNCGNCEYLLGSRCAAFEKGILGGGPSYGNFICKKTDCTENGKTYKNGESWCVRDSNLGNGSAPEGSRDFRNVCVDGEIKVEPCTDFRQQACIDGGIKTEDGNFRTAGCRVNRWQECVAQTDKEACENQDRRDCVWMNSVTGFLLGGQTDSGLPSNGAFSNPTSTPTTFTNPTSTGTPSIGKVVAPITGNAVAPITGNALFGGDDNKNATEKTTTNRPDGICVPNIPPGLKFWEDGESKGICGQAVAKCVVTFEKKLIGGKKCVENCECLEDGWAQQVNKVCAAMGDCGGYVNYLGKYTESGYEWRVDGKKQKFTPNQINQIKSSFTGKVIVETAVGVGIFAYIMSKIGLGSAASPEDKIIDLESLASPTELSGGADASGISKAATQSADGVGAAASTAAPVVSSALSPAPALADSGAVSSVLAPATDGAVSVTTIPTGADAIPWNTGVGASDSYGLGRLNPGGGSGAVKPIDLSNLGAAEKPFTGNQATLAKWFGTTPGTGTSALLSGLQWAGIAYGIGYLVGSIAGMTPKNTQALSLALAGGAFTYEGLASYEGWFGLFDSTANAQLAAAGAGIVIAAAIFIFMYSKESTEVVTFNCLPWQAPNGGADCEKCNDGKKPCSEYRCKALGQSCAIVNKGTAEERCVNINPKDVNEPKITPTDKELTVGYKYTNVKTSPPGPGFKIVSNLSTGCVKAFTPLKFGFSTDEPAQCKIDLNHTLKFDDMQFWVGGNNMFLYNHSEKMVLPGTKDLENVSGLIFENGKELTLFLRCKDNNGNENAAEYAVRFCTDSSPDNTAPEIKATSIASGSCVAEEQSDANVDFYTNEPADCKWSKEDKAYENMENTMVCQNQIYQLNALQLYTCTAKLSGIPRDGTNFYVRCKDQPYKLDADRNKNAQSFVYNLRGSNKLKIKSISPNGTVDGAVRPAPVELYAETMYGCDNGKARCYYSATGKADDYILFYETNTESGIHRQTLSLDSGEHNYYIKCVDGGGNVAEEKIEFDVDIDTNAPVVSRVYNEDGMLKVVTVRDTECVYSLNDCDYQFAEGQEMPYANSTVHVTEWNTDKTYFIKCRDAFKNEPIDCSMIVRPYQNAA